jgi:hypothetical protein
MAKGVTVFGLRGRDTQPVWRLEASWWDESELRRDPRFNYEAKIPGYDDYIAEMTLEEARQLATKYRRNAFPWQRGSAETLRERLDALGSPIHLVRVLVFEWGADDAESRR